MQRCWQSSPGSIRHSSWSSPGRLLGNSASVPSDRASRLAISVSETGVVGQHLEHSQHDQWVQESNRGSKDDKDGKVKEGEREEWMDDQMGGVR